MEWWEDSEPVSLPEQAVDVSKPSDDSWWLKAEPASGEQVQEAVQSLDIRDRLEQSSIPNLKAGMMSLAASVVSPIQRVLGYDAAADKSNIIAEQYNQAAEQIARSRTDYPIIPRSIRGVVATLPAQVIAARIGGPYAGLALAAGQEANQAITEGRQAGLKGSGLAAYSLSQGAIEGTVGAVFQKIGLGGVEKLLGSKPAEQAVKQGIGNVFKEVAKTAAQELPEELLTEIGHAVTSRLAGVDPNALSPESLRDLVANTAAQTILTVGVVESPRIVDGLTRPNQAPPQQQPQTSPEESAALDSRLTELAGQQQAEPKPPIAEPWLEDAANEQNDTVSQNTPVETPVDVDPADPVSIRELAANAGYIQTPSGHFQKPGNVGPLFTDEGLRSHLTLEGQTQSEQQPETATGEVLSPKDDSVFIWKDGKRQRVAVSTVNENDGWKVKRIKLHSEDGSYEPVDFPDEAGRGYDSPEEAEADIHEFLQNKYPPPPGLPAPADSLPSETPPTKEPPPNTNEVVPATNTVVPPETVAQEPQPKRIGPKVTPQVTEPPEGTKYVLPSFVTQPYAKPADQQADPRIESAATRLSESMKKRTLEDEKTKARWDAMTPDEQQELFNSAVEKNRKWATDLVSAIDSKNIERLKVINNGLNPDSKAVFEEVTGLKMGKTQKEGNEVLRQYVGAEAWDQWHSDRAAKRKADEDRRAAEIRDREIKDAISKQIRWSPVRDKSEVKPGESPAGEPRVTTIGEYIDHLVASGATLRDTGKRGIRNVFTLNYGDGWSSELRNKHEVEYARRKIAERDGDTAEAATATQTEPEKRIGPQAKPEPQAEPKAPPIQSPPVATKKAFDPTNKQEFRNLSPAHARFQQELDRLGMGRVIDEDDATIIRAIFAEATIDKFAKTSMRPVPVTAMRDGAGNLVSGAAARVAKLRNRTTGEIVGHELEAVAAAMMPPGTPPSVSVILHELGHVAWDYLDAADRQAFRDEIYRDGSEIKDVMRSRHGDDAAWHFASNPDEAFAQLFADTMLARSTPAQDGSAVARWIQKILDILERILTGAKSNLSPELQAKLDRIMDGAIGYSRPTKRIGPQTPPDAAGRSDTLSQTGEQTPASRLADKVAERLRQPEPLTSDEFFKLADQEFGGTRSEGKYGDSEAYDALELAVNKSMLGGNSPAVDAAKAKETVASMEAMSDRLPRHKARTGEKDTLQQFSTPPAYAYVANWAANINPSDVVLEPSAGTGGLAVHAVNAGAAVYGNEIDPDRRKLLAILPLAKTFGEDAEHIAAILPGKMPAPTVVVMNPPFSRAGHRMGDKMVVGTDRKHIDQALQLLAPGGRLVAIVGAGLHGRGKGFADWLSNLPYDVRADIEIGRDVYKGHGTTFPTRLLVIDKPLYERIAGLEMVAESPGARKARQDENERRGLDRETGRPKLVSGSVETLSEAIDLLEGVRNDRNRAAQQQSPEPAGERRIGPAQAESRPDVPVQPPTSGVDAGQGTGLVAGNGESVQQPVAHERTDDVRVEPGSGNAGASVSGTGKQRIGPRSSEPTGQPIAKPEPAGASSGASGQSVQQPSGKAAKPADSGRVVTKPEPKDRQGVGKSEPVTPAKVETATVEKAVRSKKKELGESTYEPYEPRVQIKGAKKHPASIVESAAMSAIDPPEVTYAPKIPAKVIAGYKDGDTQVGISDLQLEAVATAGQAHSQILPNGDRRGFMIGDGTGVGKAREIAGIILDNWNQGRKKAVWISKNSSLFEPAKEEWSRVGGDKSIVFSQSKIDSGKGIDAKQGILFTTYSTLGGDASDKAKQAGNAKSRLDQIVDWFGEDFDGVIVFDESHQMGSATTAGKGRNKKQASRQALAGVDLQAKLPKARVVYLSATSATEVANLAYATRLGLWGEGTAFSDRSRFISDITDGGVAAMEKVAADMKAMGMYLARNIAFNDGTPEGTVTYDRIEHKLTPDQHAAYDKMAEAWAIVFQNMNEAMKLTGAADSGKAKGDANGQFWSANQRFWNQVITAMQTPAIIQAIEKDIAEGRSAVVQLTNTNEAAQTRALANRDIDDEEDDDLSRVDVSPKYILMDYIERSFPTTKYEEYMDDEGNLRSRPVKDSEGNPVHDPEALAMKAALLDQLGSLQVASRGALDMILDHFGEDQVAEITGRGERLLRRGDKTIRQKRTPASRKADANQFMDGRKKVLIFSEAGGTGSSYHADLSRKNQDKRHHYLLQAGWRADAAIQGLGRTHRSNQAQAPKYFLVHTNLKGQKRFISTIARRLSQLGALTKGQRSTGDSGVFSAADNLESTEARDALRRLYRDAVSNQIPDIDLNFLENTLGLTLRDSNGNLKAELPPITQFMNRVLSLPVDKQNAVFDVFQSRVDALVEHAIATGTLDQGMETVKADRIEKVSEQTVFRHSTGAEARHVVVNLHRKTKPKTWEQVQNKRVTKYVQSKQTDKVFTVEATGQTDQDLQGRISNSLRLVGPGESQYTTEDKMYRSNNWTELDEKDAEKLWNEQVASMPAFSTDQMHILSGVLLPVWDRLPQGNTQVKRLLTEDGEQILGRVIPKDQIKDVLKKLGVSMSAPKITPEQAVASVMRGGKLVLANDWEIKKVRVEGETLIEVRGPEFTHDAELDRQGVFKRRIQYSTRYFIPTGSEAARVMGNVLKDRPIVEITGDDQVHAMAEPVQEAGKQSPTRQTRSTEARKDGDEQAGIAAADIVKTWERTFGVPIRVGGFSRRAAGIYKVLPEIVRTKENHYANLAVAAHEVAHHIDKVTDISNLMPNNLRNEIKGLDYEPKGRVFEGFAEFVRHFITETDSQAVAPQFHKWFTETWMPENPRWSKPLLEAQKQARAFADQSVFQRIRAMIFDRGSAGPRETGAYDRFKQGVNSRAAVAYRTWVDRFEPLRLVQEAEGGRSVSEDAGVYDTAMAYDMTSNANAAMALEQGPHRLTDDKVIGPSLWKLREHLEQGEYDEAVTYAYARHTLHENERDPNYNTGLDVEDAKALIDDVAPEKARRFEAFAKGLAEYNNALLDVAVDAGALNPEARDKMIERYGDAYFPLYRVTDKDQSQSGLAASGSKLVNLPNIVRGRSRKGSGRPIMDPFDATVAKSIFFYGRAAKARVIHRLVTSTVPQFGAPDGMGGFVDEVDPKRVVTHGKIEEILKTLVEEGVVEEADARAMTIAARIMEGETDMLSQKSIDFFLARHGLEADQVGGDDWDYAASTEPNAAAVISLWRPDFTPSASKSTVLYHDQAGKPHLLEVDGELYRAITGMDDIQVNPYLKIFASSAKFLKAGAVNLSTAFGLKNAVRDFAEFQGRAQHVEGTESLSKPVEMMGRYIAYKSRQLAGLPSIDPLIDTYERAGGKLFNRLGIDIASRTRERKRKIGRTNNESALSLGDIKDYVGQGLEGLQELIAISDAPPRLADGEAAVRKLGYEARRGEDNGWYSLETGHKVDLPEHVKIAFMNAVAESTVNFKRAGNWGRNVNVYSSFFNAVIQASYRELQQVKAVKRSLFRKVGEESSPDADAAARRYLVYLSGMASLGVLTYLLRGDDDDWREQEDWEREKEWSWGTNGRTYWRIPKPRDAGGLATNFTESLLASLNDSDRKGVVSELTGVASRAASDRLPDIGGGLTKGAVEAFVADYDYFRGKSLTPDHLKHEPKELQFTPYTLETSKAIGKATAKVGISPIQAEHLLNSASGGLYRRQVDALEAIAEGRVGPQHIPGVAAVYLNRHQAASLDDFYTRWNKVGVELKLAEANTDKVSVKKLAEEKEKLDDYAKLLTQIRAADPRDSKGRREGLYEPFLVGLAREAMGREPMESNPSPFTAEVAGKLPDSIKTVIKEFAARKAKTAVLSTGMPLKAREGDDSLDESIKAWDISRKSDEAWLKDHQDSPIVKEAIQGVLRSPGYRDLLHRKGRPAWPTSGKDWLTHVAETKRWASKVERAEAWRQEIQNLTD